MIDNITLVITSINKPNYVIKRLYNICKENNVKFLIIGDKKTPTYKKKYPLVSINNQKKLEFKLAKLLPENSYSRKNIGYLLAAKNKSNIIIETDDDNYPLENFFINLSKKKKIKVRFNPVNTYIPPIKVQIIEIISWPKIGIRINPYFVKTRPRSNSI